MAFTKSCMHSPNLSSNVSGNELLNEDKFSQGSPLNVSSITVYIQGIAYCTVARGFMKEYEEKTFQRNPISLFFFQKDHLTYICLLGFLFYTAKTVHDILTFFIPSFRK